MIGLGMAKIEIIGSAAALEYASQCVDARNAATIQSLEAAPKKMKR